MICSCHNAHLSFGLLLQGWCDALCLEAVYRDQWSLLVFIPQRLLEVVCFLSWPRFLPPLLHSSTPFSSSSDISRLSGMPSSCVCSTNSTAIGSDVTRLSGMPFSCVCSTNSTAIGSDVSRLSGMPFSCCSTNSTVRVFWAVISRQIRKVLFLGGDLPANLKGSFFRRWSPGKFARFLF